MCRLVFWNVNRKNLTELVCKLALSTGANVIVLNECVAPVSETLEALRKNVDSCFFVPKSNPEARFHCFCRKRDLDLIEVHHGSRTSVRRLRLGKVQILLGLVHCIDIRNNDPETRQAAAQLLARDMEFVRSQQGNDRLMLMGDFNMNPYDRGMTLAMCMNAMMTRACTAAKKRTFSDQQYDLYYNPMWSLFGDAQDGPAGTYYDTSNQGPYGWNMLDQVLIHHSLIDAFEKIEILTQAGNSSLINSKGRPDKNNASDHLPIAVELKGIDCD